MKTNPDLPGQRTSPSKSYLGGAAPILESADGLLIRPLERGGFEVVIGLSKLPSRGSLRRLAACADRHVVLQRAFGTPDPEAIESQARENIVGSALGRWCNGLYRLLWPNRRSQATPGPLVPSRADLLEIRAGPF